MADSPAQVGAAKDFYKVLGVQRNATPEQIDRAWRKKIFEFQPDQVPAEDRHNIEARLKEIREAHETLADPDLRADYDALDSGSEDLEDAAASDLEFDASDRGEGDEGFSDSEEGEEEEEEEGEEVQERDRLLHWWCSKQLHRCLRKLTRMEEAGPFLAPMPWEELELDDYLEVVEMPMDLSTISDRLDAAGYEDTDGLLNPELFWSDVSLCWENCMLYYEDEEDNEAYQMAKTMAEEAEKQEDEFWTELESFEAHIEEVDPTLGNVAAAMDVAASAVEDMATVAYDQLSKGMGDWFSSYNMEENKPEKPKRDKKLDFGDIDIVDYDVEYDPNAPKSPLDYQLYQAPPPPLQDYFGHVLTSRYRYDAQRDMEDIEDSIFSAINIACKTVDEREEEEEFDGVRLKIPVQRLFPGLSKVNRAKQKPASPTMGKPRPSNASRRRAGTSEVGSVASGTSHASSRAGRAKRWRRGGSNTSGTSQTSRSSHASTLSKRSELPSSRGTLQSTMGSGVSALRRKSHRSDKESAVIKALMAKDSDSDKEKLAPAHMEVGKLRNLMQKRKKKADGDGKG